MRLPEMTVDFHCQRPAVLVAKPTRDGRYVYTALNTARREIMPERVMVKDRVAEPPTGRFQTLPG